MPVLASIAASAVEEHRRSGPRRPLPYPDVMDQPHEVEFVFAPQEEGGYHVYAPDLPGLHTQGDTLEEASANAQEALELYVEGLREEGRPLDAGVIRRSFPVPA
jgi:predicted RNase H-like HicB family nuclease